MLFKRIRILAEVNKKAAVLKCIKEKKKEIVKNLTDEAIDNLSGDLGYGDNDAEHLAEQLNDNKIGVGFLNWRNYSGAIVKNVKNRGWPDLDKVYAAAAKRLNIKPEQVENFGDADFWNELINDEIRITVENQDVTGDYEYAVVGRSGGYHGIKFDSGMLAINEKLVKQIVIKAVSEFKYNEDAFKYYDDRDFENSVSLQNDVEKEISEAVDKLLEKAENKAIISKEAKKAFSDTGKFIESAIKEMEKPEYWVDMIESNEYYEK